MKIIDFHTHPTWETPSIIDSAVTEDRFISTLRRAGISVACGSAIDTSLMSEGKDYGKIIKTLNERIFACKDRNPDFIIPGIHVHPDFVKESVEEIEKYIPRGLRLVGELVPGMLGGRVLTDPKAYGAGSFIEDGCFEIFKVCEEKGLTLSIHTSTPDEGRELASRFPHLNIVMAHAGPPEAFVERVKAVSEYDNLFFDISGSGTLLRGVVEYAYRMLGKEKILFGTDFPGYAPGAFVGMVEYADIPDEAKEYIFHINAERLLNL